MTKRTAAWAAVGAGAWSAATYARVTSQGDPMEAIECMARMILVGGAAGLAGALWLATR